MYPLKASGREGSPFSGQIQGESGDKLGTRTVSVDDHLDGDQVDNARVERAPGEETDQTQEKRPRDSSQLVTGMIGKVAVQPGGKEGAPVEMFFGEDEVIEADVKFAGLTPVHVAASRWVFQCH